MIISPKSVAIVEDGVLMRQRLTSLIEADASFRLAFSVESLQQAFAAMEREVPDALLVDLGLPDGNGLDLIRYVAQSGLSCQTLVISVFGEDDRVFECIEAGASGYLIKGQGDADLAEHLRELFSGGSPVSPRIARRLMMEVRQARMGDSMQSEIRHPASPELAKPDELTYKEYETLSQLALGYSYHEVSLRMGVTVNTVRFHVKSIYSKLYVSSRSQAVYEAGRRGWIASH